METGFISRFMLDLFWDVYLEAQLFVFSVLGWGRARVVVQGVVLRGGRGGFGV